jgi:hypothetical protein
MHTNSKTKQGNLYHLGSNKNSASAITPTIMQWEIYMYPFLLNTINILIIKKYCYKVQLGEAIVVPNTSASLQTRLAAETHLLK